MNVQRPPILLPDRSLIVPQRPGARPRSSVTIDVAGLHIGARRFYGYFTLTAEPGGAAPRMYAIPPGVPLTIEGSEESLAELAIWMRTAERPCCRMAVDPDGRTRSAEFTDGRPADPFA